MAEPLELIQPKNPAHVKEQGAVHFNYNEKDPQRSVLCSDTWCKPMSPQDFHDKYPKEYADFVKHNPQLQDRLRQLDAKNPDIINLPRIRIDHGNGNGGKRGADVSPAESQPRELKIDPRLQLDRNGRVQLEPNSRLQQDRRDSIPLQLRTDGLRGNEYDLRDPNSLYRGPNERNSLYGNGPLDLLNRNGVRNPLDIRRGYGNDGYGRGYGNDGYGNDGYGSRGYGNNGYGYDGYGNRGYGNGLDALLNPNSRGGVRGLEQLLDPTGRLGLNRQLGDPRFDRNRQYGDPRFDQNRQYLDFRVPNGEPNNYQWTLENQSKEKKVPDPPQPADDLNPKKKVVDPPQPAEDLNPAKKKLEDVKPLQPGQTSEGPQPPEDFEPRRQPAEIPAEANSNYEVRDEFDQKVKDTGAFTIKNFGDAYREAAGAKSGVAIMVVGRNIPGSEEALANIKKLQADNQNLKFLVVDRDRVDAAVKENPSNAKMKEWQNWIDTSLKACSNSGKDSGVLTSVQSLKADSTGYPAPEKVTSFHWNNNVSQELPAKASLASDATNAHTSEFRLSMNAESAKTLASQIDAARREALQTPISDLNSVRARQEKFVKALQLASQARPDLMAQRRRDIEAIQDENVRKQELAVFDQLNKAPMQLRAELGLDMMRSVADMPTNEKKAAMAQAGLEVLRDSYSSTPELTANAAFAGALRAAGVDTDKLIKESQNAARISADQIGDNLKRAYTVGDPITVTEKRTYTGNVTSDMRTSVCNPGNRRACYNQRCVLQRCCTPGGACRNFCGCGG